MSSLKDVHVTGRTWGISLDVWAVLAALMLAFLVRVGILTRVPW